jgi:hypothetical protein
MRIPLFAGLLACAATVVHADSDTAYKALRVFGKDSGDKTLDRVLEVRGRNGVPQPQVWKITANDPAARGGLVEAEVQQGKIISQRRPTARTAVATNQVMDLNQLNLDSDGAFTIANQEMEKQAVPFDRMDYVLRSPGPGKPPVWRLELLNRGGKVAIMEVAADSGILLESQILGPAGSRQYTDDRDYVDSGRGRSRNVEPRGDGRSATGEPFRGVGDFFNRLGRRFERRGHQLKRFFSGD